METIIGIICEYNPFHNGHLYHINKIKEIFPNSIIILVINGYFTQRGELCIMSKEEKTKVALNNKVDLVVELPFVFGTQSSDIFAYGAMQILDHLNADYVVFGSELNDIKTLKYLVSIQTTNEYNKLVKQYLKEGTNYPTAMSKALKEISNIDIKTPNDLLGISYIKAIKKLKSNIIPYSIERSNDYHSLEINDTTISGSAIRNLLKQNMDISPFVPVDTYNLNLKFKSINSFFDLIKYKIIVEKEEINKYQTVDEGIESRIIKNIKECNNVEELISKIKTKRYTYNKIERMLVHILCSLTKDEAKNNEIQYIRILGFNDTGRKYLSKVKKNINIPIISNLSKYDFEQLNIENRVTNIINIKQENQINEYKIFPIYK